MNRSLPSQFSRTAADHPPFYHKPHTTKMAESDFMAYGSIEMIFACLLAFWLGLQALQTIGV